MPATSAKSKRPEVLALIPARSGSKRVKNKNIRPLGEKPLIAYTIEAAKKAKLVDRVIVSTDSKKIAEIAKQYGAEVPFLRPKELAGSSSTELEFHLHALSWLWQHEDYTPDLIVNLYPTTPFRRAVTIDKAIRRMLENPRADSLRSIRKCSEHPHKMWVTEGELAKPFVSSKASSQHTLAYHQLPQVFIQNASIYITRPHVLRKYNSTIGETVLAFEMSEDESVDINTPLDFVLAKSLLDLWERGGNR